ncbi:MAG: hydantoinase/oxoprolinase family protein [Acidimicrobiales bacterium]
MSFTVNVDIGGTFTDAYVTDGDRFATGKARTTHHDLSVSFLAATTDALAAWDLDLHAAMPRVASVRYSTTVGMNALIERVGPRVGLITTRGQEDTLQVGRSRNWADGLSATEQMDRTRARRPPTLVPRPLRVGLAERVDCFGNVVMPLDPADVVRQVDNLMALGVQAVAVCLTWSFMNPAHEQLVRDVIREQYPEIYLGRTPVLLSSEVAPKLDEYRRSVTTVLAAFLATVTEEHVLDLSDRLREHGYRRPLLLARNTGGVSSPSRTSALHLLGAGAVAGLGGASALATRYGIDNVVTADMGGTTFDVGLILEGQQRTYEFDPVVDRWRIHLPVLANFSIGAGGGSIAWVTEEGDLRVGPRSAGSVPGPVAYDSGGVEPTVTDADLVLGYIDPEFFLGGRFRLDQAKAARAIRRRVARPLGIEVEEAAQRIRRLVDGLMGQEIYKQTALKGHDPRDLTMFAFGGAGPVHACDVAEYADIATVLTFPFGSEFNAYGASTMDIVQSYERTHRIALFDALRHRWFDDVTTFNGIVADLLAFAARDLEEEGFSLHDVRYELELDMNYTGQQHTVRHPCGWTTVSAPEDLVALGDAFNASFAAVYGEGTTHPEGGIEIQLFKVTATAGLHHDPPAPPPPGATGAADPGRGERSCIWAAGDPVTTPVYDRRLLRAGDVVAGPALLEDVDTVVAVAPGWTYRVDEWLTGHLAGVVP